MKLTPDYEFERDLDNPIEDKDVHNHNLDVEEKRLRALYLGWIEDYCRVEFKEPYPNGVLLALENLTKNDPFSFSVTSEKLSDMAITYNNTGDLPKYIYNWLNPYRRIALAEDKRKLVYGSNNIDNRR